MHTSLECSLTGEFHEPDRLQGLSRAGKPLLARYDLGALSGWTPEIVRSRRERSMWKFHEVLPVNGLSEAVTLGEGLTPFLKCVERGVFAGFGDLWVKDEGFNPTQSFKARGMSAAMTRAAAFGVQTVALPS
ncbi:MAG TPA: threonine synthase, partial [Planctomycetaceae bacterium]|nr:threonine synthase [Planctomycetaceae bacterium]